MENHTHTLITSISKVLMEYEAQEDSGYLPWLDSLPRLHFSAASMTDFCYECLPPLVFNLSRAEQLKFENFVNVLKKVDIISDSVKNNEEVLKWAFNSVFTRTYCRKEGQLDGDVSIAPFADMFNHAATPEVEVYFDDDGNCMAYTLVDVPANSPLRICYAGKYFDICIVDNSFSMGFLTLDFLDH